MKVIAALMTFAIIAFTSGAIVDGFCKEGTPKWAKMLYKIIFGIILFGSLILLGKCGCTFNEHYSSDGESGLEYYEPR